MREHLQRQSFLGPHSDDVLQKTVVAIIGLCGGGSHVVQQLAHVGVGHFRLFDHDASDETNRNRMLGLTATDAIANAQKTDVMQRLILGINPVADIELQPVRWQDSHWSLRDCTVIFSCVDSFIERSQLEAYARRFLIPLIDIGMEVSGESERHTISGQVILSLPGHPCMRCMGFLTEELLAREANDYGTAGGRPQVVWPNGTLASIAMGKFMSLVTPWHAELQPELYTEFDGNRQLVFPSRKLTALRGSPCEHYPGTASSVGDEAW
jgi:hypothetical protein